MEATLKSRYPGAQPFGDDELSRKLFHGREREATALTNQILANRVVVLFARSGLGKTSLINAGVVENLRAKGFVPLSIRVNDNLVGALESLYRDIAASCAKQGVEYIPGNKSSLWHFFKTSEFWKHDFLLTPVLILDQFEELFTLQSEEHRNAFIDQLSYLVRGIRPAEPSALIDRATYLDQRSRLLPLPRAAASRAVEEPANVEDAKLATKPFHIDSRGEEVILDFLARRAPSSTRTTANNIEPFQLQLICQHLEDIAARKQDEGAQENVTITPEEVGGEGALQSMLTEFYNREVQAISSFRQRRNVRRLCREFLISPQGRRLRMEGSEIKRLVNVNSDTLKTLVERRLLRADQRTSGTYYELSHDSLIDAVMGPTRWRYSFLALGSLAAAICLLGASFILLVFSLAYPLMAILEHKSAIGWLILSPLCFVLGWAC